MIKLSGTLAIRSISGSRGPFNVARLYTEIGEFAVKDSLIEEYEEGRYKGEFGITGIFPSTYFAGGRTVVEVRARLGSIALENITALHDADHAAPSEPDPIEASATPAVPIETPAPAAEPIASPGELSDTAPEASTGMALQALFGELWPLGDQVKLDPTVDRQRFRQQVKAIGKDGLGYVFQPVGQVWVKE